MGIDDHVPEIRVLEESDDLTEGHDGESESSSSSSLDVDESEDISIDDSEEDEEELPSSLSSSPPSSSSSSSYPSSPSAPSFHPPSLPPPQAEEGGREEEGEEGEEEGEEGEEEDDGMEEEIFFDDFDDSENDNSERREDEEIRRPIISGLNIVFRKERRDKEEKKKDDKKKSIFSIIRFDYLEFDDQYLRLNNEVFLSLLQKFYAPTSSFIPPSSSFSRIATTLLQYEKLMSLPEGRREEEGGRRVGGRRELIGGGGGLSFLNSNQHVLSRMLRNSNNPMLMVVSNDNHNVLEFSNVDGGSLRNFTRFFRQGANLMSDHPPSIQAPQENSVAGLLQSLLEHLPDQTEEEMLEEPFEIEEEEKMEMPEENKERIEETKENEGRVEERLDPVFLESLMENQLEGQINMASQTSPQAQTQAGMEQVSSVEMDNRIFFESLTPELRREVMMNSDPEFLGTLPANYVQDYMELLRRQEPRRLAIEEENDNDHDDDEEEEARDEEDQPHSTRLKKKKGEKRIFTAHHQKEQLARSPNGKQLLADNQLLSLLLLLLRTDSLSFRAYPFNLFRTLCYHPGNENKLFDALFEILRLDFSSNGSTTSDLEEKEGSSFIFGGKGGSPKKSEVQMILGPLPLIVLEKDFVLSNKRKVFEILSLKVLALLGEQTEQSVSYFLRENDTNEGAEANEMNPFKHASGSSSNGLRELICLLEHPVLKSSFIHLKLLLNLLFNVIKRGKILLERRSNTKSVSSTFSLESLSIATLCRTIDNDLIDENSVKNLNFIITSLAGEGTNLPTFILEIKRILGDIGRQLNLRFSSNLELLKRNRENGNFSEILNRIEEEIEGENRIFRIFRIIKMLFERCLISNSGKGGEEKQKINKEIRETFKTLIDDRGINEMWINLTELLTVLNTLYPDSVNLSNPIIHKTIPILESFFIIYRIMYDDESLEILVEKRKKHQKYQMNRKIELSTLVHEEEEEREDKQRLQKFKAENKIDFDEMFGVMCEQNKNIINMMVRQNVGLLNESFSMIIRKMPKILDFENKKSFFRVELKKIKGPALPPLSKKFICTYKFFVSKT